MIDEKTVEQARNTDVIAFFEKHCGFTFAYRGGAYRCQQHQSLAVARRVQRGGGVMKSLLQQLYDGEVYPSENIKCDTPEYLKLGEKIGDEKQYFKATLSPDDWSRFDKLEDMMYERSSAYSFATFTYGFRLGVGLMIEALASGEELIRDKK